MKKVLMIFSFIAVCAMSYAQQDQKRTFDSEKRAEHVVGLLVDTLELNMSQAESLKESYITLFSVQQINRQASTSEGGGLKMAIDAHLVRVKELLNDDNKFKMYTQLKSGHLQGWNSKGKYNDNRSDVFLKLIPEERANKIAAWKVNYIADTLQLSEVQKKALHEVYVKQVLQKGAKREKEKVLRKKNKEAQDEDIKQILQDEEKFETYKALQIEHRKEKKNRKRNSGKPSKKHKNKGR